MIWLAPDIEENVIINNNEDDEDNEDEKTTDSDKEKDCEDQCFQDRKVCAEQCSGDSQGVQDFQESTEKKLWGPGGWTARTSHPPSARCGTSVFLCFFVFLR